MKNSISNMDTTYSLNNNDNYLKTFPNKYDALNKLSDIICEYIKIIFENKKMTSSKYSHFVMLRGLETLINVYLILLYNTNNLDLAIYHTHRSFVFYLEFVEQITDEQHTFLQLTSRDATMYVYKKTIFDVKREISIDDTSEKNVDFTYMNNMAQLFKLIGRILIHQKKENQINIEKLKFLFHKMKKNKYSLEHISKLISFLSKLENDCDILDEFTKFSNKITRNDNS